MEGDPQHVCGSIANLDATGAQPGGRLNDGGSSGLGVGEVVGDRERLHDLVAVVLVPCAQDDVLGGGDSARERLV